MMLTRTFLAWDLAGSTRAWESEPSVARASVSAWVTSARSVAAAHGGSVFKLVGDGGWVAFESASGAVEAARALMLEKSEGALPARVAMYSGEAEQQADGDWLGVPLNRCARLLSLGHPGQVLVAGSTALLVGVDRRVLRELGLYHLRDVDEPIVVYQLVSDGLAAEFPPLRSDVRHVSLPVPRGLLVGRASELEHVASLLRDHRLLTLTGVDGTGKSRLAIETEHLSSGRAHQNLGAVCGVLYSSRAVHRSTEVVVVTFLRRAAVETHAD